MHQLQRLLDLHCFWARGRSLKGLDAMLRGSSAIVTAWRQDGTMVGFGRATCDGVYRAVLWDVVIANGDKGLGLGRRLVETLLSDPRVAGCERTYLMTSQSRGFYERLGFQAVTTQSLMLLDSGSCNVEPVTMGDVATDRSTKEDPEA
jgi:N-acetylglutamate synthase-like GNAT family acetyltransferase